MATNQIIIYQSDQLAIIGDEDYQRVVQHKWYLLGISGASYVVTSIKNKGGQWTNEYLHRFIMNAPRNMVVEYLDGNTLNNVRENLKVCSRRDSQAAYDKIKAKSVSPYRGVTINRNGKKKWRAQIAEAGAVYYLGSFLTEAEAASAYDVEARRRFGVLAQLNFPEPL